MLRLSCPLEKKYISNGKVCVLNQLFGENKNSSFYGPEGHSGIDINTVWGIKYRRSDEGWLKEERTNFEKEGRIPVIACHDGKTTTVLNPDKDRQGWGIYVTADSYLEGTMEVQYRTLYWHIETPWNSLAAFTGVIKRLLPSSAVKGQVIAIAGNNGMSTGPHLHLELQKRVKTNGVWGAWDRLNPLLAFVDQEVVYLMDYVTSQRWFYKGEEITKLKAQEILKTLLPVKL